MLRICRDFDHLRCSTELRVFSTPKLQRCAGEIESDFEGLSECVCSRSLMKLVVNSPSWHHDVSSGMDQNGKPTRDDVFWSFGAHLIVGWFHQHIWGSNQENYRNTTNELMSWLTRLGIQGIWVWVKMGAILFKLQDLPKLYWRAKRSSFVVFGVSPHFRSTRAPQICEVEAMLFCLCLKTQLPVKLMACLVRLCIAYMSRWQNGRNPGAEVLTSENPKWIIWEFQDEK